MNDLNLTVGEMGAFIAGTAFALALILRVFSYIEDRLMGNRNMEARAIMGARLAVLETKVSGLVAQSERNETKLNDVAESVAGLRTAVERSGASA